MQKWTKLYVYCWGGASSFRPLRDRVHSELGDDDRPSTVVAGIGVCFARGCDRKMEQDKDLESYTILSALCTILEVECKSCNRVLALFHKLNSEGKSF